MKTDDQIPKLPEGKVVYENNWEQVVGFVLLILLILALLWRQL